MEQAKRTAEIMHQLGMKVDFTLAGRCSPKRCTTNCPRRENWEQRNQDNHWVPYGLQTFRHYACPNEPAYRDYIKRILKIGVEDLHADQILFDNIMLQPEPDSCRCPRCIQAFHDYLRQKISDQGGRRAPVRSAGCGLDPGERVGQRRRSRTACRC